MKYNELRQMLLAHEEWMTTQHLEGHRFTLENKDITENYLAGSNLRGAIISNCNLSNVTLRNSNLRSAIINNSNLSDADLRNTDLRGADFRGSNLTRTRLSGCDMREAILPARAFSLSYGKHFVFYFNESSLLVDDVFFTLNEWDNASHSNGKLKALLNKVLILNTQYA